MPVRFISEYYSTQRTRCNSHIHRRNYTVHYFENTSCSLNTNFSTYVGLDYYCEYAIHMVLRLVNKYGNVVNYYCIPDNVSCMYMNPCIK